MQLRDMLALEMFKRRMSMAEVAKQLSTKRATVGKIVRRLKKAGLIDINRETKPFTITVLDVAPANGGYIKEGYLTTEQGGLLRKLWGLRNFACKFSIEKGQLPPEKSGWRQFKKGWRGGLVLAHYVRGCRVELYWGSKHRTLVIYASPDMEANDPRALENDAIDLIKGHAHWLAEKLGWSLSEQLNVLGRAIPIKRGEYDNRALQGVAKTFRELGLTPVYHEKGKIDKSPKPAAFQIYTAEQAARVWEAPQQIDKLLAGFEDYNKNIKLHLKVLRQMSKTLKRIDEKGGLRP